jgi:hypothetical protein
MESLSRSGSLRALYVALSLSVGLGGALGVGMIFQARSRAHAAASNLPPALPSHFSFGVMDAPGDVQYLNGMRSSNGTAWDYRYQYLAAGVNTGHGWETWNSPAGQFATDYLQESGNNNYVPAFVYYELQQSNGSCGGCGEAQKDLSNLSNPTTMAAYYANWALLMHKVGAYARPTLIIVEPDLWGFMEQAAVSHGNSAAGVPASVSSSGYPDAAGLPDTGQGFAWALLRMRDRYAHNAVLALHASVWGIGIDIDSNPSGSIDAAALGARQAQFLDTAGLTGTPSGLSTFELVSNDVADHDSGQSGIWWDPTNVTFPNFARYLRYAAALSAGTGRRIVMWQVPAGNQYFDTENNSSGHTQDNKAQYILSHISAFASAGVMAVLFGPGNGGTMVNDARQDGITNPASISTYQCNQCNNHTSAYPDDDGGYLRINVGQYYKYGPYALSGSATTGSGGTTGTGTTGNTPSPGGTTVATGTCVPHITFGAGNASPTTVAAGATAILSAALTASCPSAALLDFEVYSANGGKVWQTWQDNQSLTGQPQTFQAKWVVRTSQASGRYVFKLGVFAPGWGKIFGWNNGVATLTVGPPTTPLGHPSSPVPLDRVPCYVTVGGTQEAGTCTGVFVPAAPAH